MDVTKPAKNMQGFYFSLNSKYKIKQYLLCIKISILGALGFFFIDFQCIFTLIHYNNKNPRMKNNDTFKKKIQVVNKTDYWSMFYKKIKF